jgi:heptose I phosphotransferase
MLVLPESWLARWRDQDVFEHLFTLEGKVYREQKGRKTLRFHLDGKNYFAKLHRGVGWQEILRNLCQFRLPVLSAQNEWRAVHYLHGLGIKTMRLVGYGRRGWNPAKLQSFVITEELADTVSLEDFCRDWPISPPRYSLKRALITEVARIVRTLHESGMNHRDLYICHLLLEISAGEEDVDPRNLSLYLIDLHRMQARRRIPRRWRVKDLAALFFSSMDIGLTQRDLLRFIRVYRDKPLRAMLDEDRALWLRVRRRGIALYRDHFQRDPMIPL